MILNLLFESCTNAKPITCKILYLLINKRGFKFFNINFNRETLMSMGKFEISFNFPLEKKIYRIFKSSRCLECNLVLYTTIYLN